MVPVMQRLGFSTQFNEKQHIFRYRESAEWKEQVVRSDSTTVNNLQPFTLYEFVLVAENTVGEGNPSLPVEVETLEEGPPACSCALPNEKMLIQRPKAVQRVWKLVRQVVRVSWCDGSRLRIPTEE